MEAEERAALGLTAQTSVVESLYAALRQGDMDALRALLAADVEWACATESDSVPWLIVQRGRDEVVESLRNLPGMTVSAVAQSFLETGDVVAATVRFEARLRKPAGYPAGDPAEWTHCWTEVHHWQFDAAGLICNLRQRTDAAARAAVSGAGRLVPFTPRPDAR